MELRFLITNWNFFTASILIVFVAMALRGLIIILYDKSEKTKLWRQLIRSDLFLFVGERFEKNKQSKLGNSITFNLGLILSNLFLMSSKSYSILEKYAILLYLLHWEAKNNSNEDLSSANLLELLFTWFVVTSFKNFCHYTIVIIGRYFFFL